MASEDTNRGAKRARQAREALGLPADAPLDCVLTVVEERAQLPVVVAGLPDHLAGACFRSDGGTVIWVNGTQQVTRQRFTLAHELAHAWCGHDGAQPVDSVATISGRTTNPYEIQANAFAAEFLVPRACLDEVIDRPPTLEDVAVIAAHCRVNPIVVAYRLRTLRLADDRRLQRLEDEIAAGFDPHPRSTVREDRLANLGGLPYLSPALDGTALATAVRDDGPTDPRLSAAVARLLR